MEGRNFFFHEANLEAKVQLDGEGAVWWEWSYIHVYFGYKEDPWEWLNKRADLLKSIQSNAPVLA